MKRTHLLLGVLAGIVLVIGGVTGGPYLWQLIQYLRHERTAAAREPAAMAAWRQAYGDPQARVAWLTRADDNPTAERLVVLAKPLGIVLESLSQQASSFTEASAIGRYVNTAGDLTEPSVRAYLEAHRSDIASIVDVLTTSEPPVWRSAVSPPLPVPEPSVSILAVRLLNNVLAADAILEASEGRAEDADRAVRAAWQVMRSARDQPLMFGQLIAIALTTADLGAVRRTADAETCLNSSRSVVVSPGRWPASRSAWRTQRRKDSVRIPSLSPTDRIAAHCDACSGVWPKTIRTARSRTSGEYLLGRPIGHILSRNGPSDKPGTIQFSRRGE
jgi:hypothetical protein